MQKASSPADRVRLPLMRQTWSEVVFLHWEADPAAVTGLLPPGTAPDVWQGRTFVGVVALHLAARIGGRLPLLPLGSFDQVNVRVYVVDDDGRRGVVFGSLDASQPVAAFGGRVGYGLPYHWSAVRSTRGPGELSYAVRRRGRAATTGTGTSLTVRVGDPVPEPSGLETFLTARWALYWRRAGRTLRAGLEHPPWQLYRAELLALDDSLVPAAGLPAPAGDPVSVLWSPGTSALLGAPHLVSG